MLAGKSILEEWEMNITMLGTGHANATECCNTCFVLWEQSARQMDNEYPSEYFLIDGSGGNTIFKQLLDAGINWKDIRTVFVTHKHLDHITGIIWLIRMAGEYMSQQQYMHMTS